MRATLVFLRSKNRFMFEDTTFCSVFYVIYVVPNHKIDYLGVIQMNNCLWPWQRSLRSREITYLVKNIYLLNFLHLILYKYSQLRSRMERKNGTSNVNFIYEDLIILEKYL